MLNQQNPFPEQINITILTIALFYTRLKGCDPFAGNAEDVKKPIPKGLCLSVFRSIGRVVPREMQGAILDFIPR